MPTSIDPSINSFKLKRLASRCSTTKGFSLIELLVVISIIGILSAIGIITYSGYSAKARDSKRKTDLRSIKVALELYKATNGSFPSTDWANSGSLGNWIPGLDINYFPDGVPLDPLNTGGDPKTSATGYKYYYRSFDTDTRWPGCSASGNGNNNFFVLVVQLENKKDSENLNNKLYKWCDGSSILTNPTLTWSGTTFVVTSL